uniref:JmjC domain-containing protein n=1 Tax=viral metagenome TaxID=1070528 RepID=A0A6C0LNP1_9ZZZZ
MKIIIRVFIFCLVLFIYLHIQFHLKTSNDLEIFELDDPTKDKLEQVCDLRQPVVFNYVNDHFLNASSFKQIVNNYYAFDIKIRSVKRPADDNGELFLPLSLNGAVKLFNEDNQSSYYSENNKDFLQETGVIKSFSYNDSFFRPYMVSNCNYDILLGSVNSTTPFRYNHNYRNFFMVTQGSIQIKLAPPQSIKYLSPEYDYENFEFRSLIDVWAPESKFKVDYDKVQFIDFTLQPGKAFFIPAYWWYSIKILEKNTLVSIFNYRTYMNNLAITPYFVLHGLQLLNVKRNIAKVNNNNRVIVENDEPRAEDPTLDTNVEEPKDAEKKIDED